MVLSVAVPASATTYVKLISASMNQNYRANISGVGNVYSNGVTFQVKNSTAGGVTSGDPFELFGFCVDIYHQITMGNLGYVYESNEDLNILNPLPEDFGGNDIDAPTLSKITDLVNTGYQLHQNEKNANNFDFDSELRLAAIQAAIWQVEVPSRSITVKPNNLDPAGFALYQQYFTEYSTGAYTPLGDLNDRFYVITDGVHQSFAIGWPIDGVPEPGTWLMMIMGFGGVGAVLRRRRETMALAA